MSTIEVSKLHSLSGHKDSIYVLEEANDRTKVYSAAGDGMVVEWPIYGDGTGHLIAKVQNSVYALHHHPASNALFVGHNQSGIHKIDLVSKQEIGSAAITDTSIFDIKSVGKYLLVGTQDGMLIIMDSEDLSVYKRIKASSKSLRTIAVNPDIGHIACGFSDNYIRIYDLQNLKLLYEFVAHDISVFSLQYAPHGGYLISGSRDAHLKIWEVEAGYSLFESIVAHMYAINHIVFSPSGKYFASCSMDKSIKIWDANSFQLLKVIDKARHAGHGTSVNKLFWSQDESTLLSCSDDRSISVWKLDFHLKSKEKH